MIPHCFSKRRQPAKMSPLLFSATWFCELQVSKVLNKKPWKCKERTENLMDLMFLNNNQKRTTSIGHEHASGFAKKAFLMKIVVTTLAKYWSPERRTHGYGYGGHGWDIVVYPYLFHRIKCSKVGRLPARDKIVKLFSSRLAMEHLNFNRFLVRKSLVLVWWRPVHTDVTLCRVNPKYSVFLQTSFFCWKKGTVSTEMSFSHWCEVDRWLD